MLWSCQATFWGIKLVEPVDGVCWGRVELINGSVNTVNNVFFFFLHSIISGYQACRTCRWCLLGKNRAHQWMSQYSQ
ncbi:hypothetical protein LAZ67_6003995 [Cordylochernes scorpioides]|uniref:Uncharacterized protein n=1 Tax=Cordylochernes scorpioides TaxID=51811 RepID=A0ABY6KL25_9ARAC|nr:hypothetical protein LAZ67_6003995 [Cordylochernes scorpioides]